MKLNLEQLRRSPRLNPPPRRSPRIQEINEHYHAQAESPSATSEKDNDNNDALPRRRVKVGRRNNTIRVVQNYNEEDPPSRVKRAGGKRSLEDSSEKRAKRIKNNGPGKETVARNCRWLILAKVLIVLGSALVVGASVQLLKTFVLGW